MRELFFILALSFSINASAAELFKITDDDGRVVSFEQPAKRIISLSPHATELLFAAGATKQIIATVSYSDYPEAAKKIPRIGSHNKIDLESVIRLNPDLIIVWNNGGSAQQIKDLIKLGYKVYSSEPKKFEDVAINIQKLGKILGTSDVADKKASAFLKELEALKQRFTGTEKIKVFYQVWNQPLMTINNGHMITDIIEFCGGVNVFASLRIRAPKVDIESVIDKNPQAIIIGMSENRKNWVESWHQWKSIDAVKNNQIFTVNADLIVRQGPRVLQGAKLVCEALEKVRR